jgi:hypothetical protein
MCTGRLPAARQKETSKKLAFYLMKNRREEDGKYSSDDLEDDRRQHVQRVL